MTSWIVILIVLAALSPLAWLRPSRKQAGQITLRAEARRMGLAMQLAPVQWPHWFEPEPPSPCAQFYRQRRKGHESTWSYWQPVAGQWVNQWREPCDDRALLEHLGPLAANVYKVEADRQLIAVYWGERGEVQTLEQIQALLEAFA